MDKEACFQRAQSKLRSAMGDQIWKMAVDLKNRPRGIDKFNVGLTDERAPDAHIPLPGIMDWEKRKETYHDVYIDEIGAKLGMELSLRKANIQGLSLRDMKKLLAVHHGKMELEISRISAAERNLPQRLLNDARSFRRHPVVERWEKISCRIGADEYIFYKLPDALRTVTGPFCGMYIVCHHDTERMEGDHIIITGMENRLANLRSSVVKFYVAQFRVELDLAEVLLDRLNRLEAQLSVPLGRARHMDLAMRQCDMVGELQERVDQDVEESIEPSVVVKLASRMQAFVKELGQELNSLKAQPHDPRTGRPRA
mmetsp:Transcript_29170/g.90916  ORF Transcript_29170/g.90916 Transcript_29170/m.90916 type:complete len:312 (+) Transcript_29170:128-1063(+)